MKSEEKTNVMRLLDQKKIPYASHTYVHTGAVSAVAFYLLLGPDGFILPALGASMVALMLLRDRVWLKMKEEQERA